MMQGSTAPWHVRLRWLLAVLPLLLAAAIAIPHNVAAAPGNKTGTYTNPLPIQSEIGLVESCADPTVIENYDEVDEPDAVKEYEWYMYCTTDPLNDADRDANGNFVFHSIPQFGSDDLVNWVYLGDAFTAANRPEAAAPTAGLWAPEVDYINGQYYMFFGITDLADAYSPEPNCGGDNAIAYATSADADGPWTYQGIVVQPRRAGGGCNFYWTFDPEVFQDPETGDWYIYYGSYFGGIEARPLTIEEDGTVPVTDPASAVLITIPNRYEGPEVVYRDGYYYLFVSATNCCAGERTGYSVFVGRAESPLGTFYDQQGNSFLDARVGGTPFLTMNGNEWVGPGHNTVFTDEDGQWWTIYHAVNRFDPCFAGTDCFTKRPALLDPVDWINGWPTVNGGAWASNTPMPAPAAVEGQKSRYKTTKVAPDALGKLLYAEEFNDAQGEWTWFNAPAGSVENGVFRFPTQAKDLFQDNNSASVLLLPATSGDYVVETKVHLNLPAGGCCFNYTQAGLVVFGDANNYVKLVHVSIWETRQTEWAREAGGRYGNTVVGAPSDWTWLRIVKRTVGSEDHFQAYTSQDGVNWVRGGVWTLPAGTATQVGLVSMGGAGFEARFDYVRIYSLKPGNGYGRGSAK